MIHPGSRNIRIGRACDVNPITIPNIIARKQKLPVPEPTYVQGIARPRTKSKTPTAPATNGTDEYSVAPVSDDPVSLSRFSIVSLVTNVAGKFDVTVSSTTVSLRERMRFYKLRVTQNATSIASAFNESFKPEILPDYMDPYNVDWITKSTEDVIVGEKVRFFPLLTKLRLNE